MEQHAQTHLPAHSAPAQKVYSPDFFKWPVHTLWNTISCSEMDSNQFTPMNKWCDIWAITRQPTYILTGWKVFYAVLFDNSMVFHLLALTYLFFTPLTTRTTRKYRNSNAHSTLRRRKELWWFYLDLHSHSYLNCTERTKWLNIVRFITQLISHQLINWLIKMGLFDSVKWIHLIPGLSSFKTLTQL